MQQKLQHLDTRPQIQSSCIHSRSHNLQGSLVKIKSIHVNYFLMPFAMLEALLSWYDVKHSKVEHKP